MVEDYVNIPFVSISQQMFHLFVHQLEIVLHQINVNAFHHPQEINVNSKNIIGKDFLDLGQIQQLGSTKKWIFCQLSFISIIKWRYSLFWYCLVHSSSNWCFISHYWIHLHSNKCSNCIPINQLDYNKQFLFLTNILHYWITIKSYISRISWY